MKKIEKDVTIVGEPQLSAYDCSFLRSPGAPPAHSPPLPSIEHLHPPLHLISATHQPYCVPTITFCADNVCGCGRHTCIVHCYCMLVYIPRQSMPADISHCTDCHRDLCCSVVRHPTRFSSDPVQSTSVSHEGPLLT